MKNNFTAAIIIFLQGCFLAFAICASGKSSLNQPLGEQRLKNDPIIIDTLQVNNLYPAEGVQLYKDEIIILSHSKYQKKMIPDHIPFGRMGTYLINPDNPAPPNKPLFAGNLFPVTPEGMSFTGDYSILYYTAIAGTYRTGITKKIHKAPVVGSKTPGQASVNQSGIEVLPFCTGFDSYMHPAVAPDNSFLIFASDNKQSIGGFDLFIVRYKDGRWGDPVNLGNAINSKEDELYPFIDKEFNLYFSSDGHAGFGGLDIFMCQYLGDGWSKPVNLMQPVNSRDDDVSITIDNGNRTGYFSVINRLGQFDQLFRIRPGVAGKLSEALFLSAQNEYKKLYDEDIQASADKPVTLISAVATTTPIEVKKEEKPVEVKVEKTPTVKPTIEKTPTVQPTVEKTPVEVKQEEAKEEVVFRVQIVSSTNPKSNYRVTIDGRVYPTFEYFYKGAYRYTVGEFKSAGEATAFVSKCRNAGFKQAFVASFINNERVTDR